jgi:hypothetical protein
MRFPAVHPGRCLFFAASVFLTAWGCQGPDAFYRNQDASVLKGTGGSDHGTGGATGTGGIAGTGTGGATGTGGEPTGTGGRATGTGGIATTGTGGRTTGTGGVAVTGTGGMVVVTGTGGMVVVTGTGGMVAGTGGVVGTTPCAGICDPSTTIVEFTVAVGKNYNSPNPVPLTEACFETTSGIMHANCSNLTGRTMIVNGGATVHATGMSPDTCANFVLPAPVNGGFCFQFTAGSPNYAAFSAYY